ncbi:cytochrome b-c1 complex subunit 10 [Lipomyces japonicus]|uniref:cytochrome b-c1 complex subunit 10 n=1 Tax=Lipomyces japonicus TaxID=56871 RepID=UPI0034CE3AF0
MAVTYKYTPNFLGFNAKLIARWSPVLAVWGGAAGIGALFLLEPIPRVRNDILKKIPVLGNYWERPIDPNDSPF